MHRATCTLGSHQSHADPTIAEIHESNLSELPNCTRWSCVGGGFWVGVYRREQPSLRFPKNLLIIDGSRHMLIYNFKQRPH